MAKERIFIKICPCGKKIAVRFSLLQRKKYCTKKCFYKYRIKGSGFKRHDSNGNASWFKKGHIPWSKTVAGKGILKVNKGSIKKGQHLSPKTEFNKGENTGVDNFNWKGDKVGYFSLHSWLYRHLEKTGSCRYCKKKCRTDWANKTHEYKRNTNDWIELCRKCHFKYDGNYWGLATKLYSLGK